MVKKSKIDLPELTAAELTLDQIYRPGSKLEAVFDIDGVSPDVRVVVLYEFDSRKKRAVISQTHPDILPSHVEKAMHLTKLVEAELSNTFRIGLPCHIEAFHDRYRLSSGKTDRAVQVTLHPEAAKIVNIRSAYRFVPNATFQVQARMRCFGVDFISGKDFTLENISFSGIGISTGTRIEIPEQHLLALSVDDIVPVEIQLRGDGQDFSFGCNLQVVRIDRKHVRKKTYIGARFVDLSIKDESLLSQFIHRAQLHAIRSIKG